MIKYANSMLSCRNMPPINQTSSFFPENPRHSMHSETVVAVIVIVSRILPALEGIVVVQLEPLN